MLQVPSAVEAKARFVGTHVWKADEKMTSQCSVGVQCSGKATAIVVARRGVRGSDSTQLNGQSSEQIE